MTTRRDFSKVKPVEDNRLHELKLGGRVLRKGDLVKIEGERGGLFRICSFEPDGDVVNVRGGSAGRRHDRAFFVDRIGTRVALAGTPKAEEWR